MKYLFSHFFLIIGITGYSQFVDIDHAKSILTAAYTTEIVSSGPMVNDVKNGYWVFYRNKEEDYRHSEGPYLDGVKTGDWKAYYPDSWGNRLRTKQVYRNDSLLYMILFSETLDTIFTIESKKGLGVRTADILERISYNLRAYNLFFSSGEISFQDIRIRCIDVISFIIQEQDETATIVVWEPQDGVIEKREVNQSGESKETYKYSMKKVTRTSWFENSVLTKEKQLLEGNPDNYELYLYNEGGQIEEKQVFKDGSVKHGVWIVYYPNGKKKKQQTYKSDLLHGTSKEWGENGKLTAKSSYKNGALIEK